MKIRNSVPREWTEGEESKGWGNFLDKQRVVTLKEASYSLRPESSYSEFC